MPSKGKSFLDMAVEAIGHIKSGSQGASRQAVANYISATYDKEKTGQFNAALRKALSKGVETGVLRPGDTTQRYKLGPEAHKKAPKKKAAKKKVSKKKKAAAKKKKGSSKKKKKAPAKKKKVTKKKAAPKRKAASKKKAAPKRKAKAKSSKKKTASRKKK